MTTSIPTPGTKLADDLYSLYLAGLAWLLLPVYGSGLVTVLPSDIDQPDRALDALALIAMWIGFWVGARGGPFMVHRAGVLHELASPRSLRRQLVGRYIRQSVAYGTLGAIAVSVLLAISVPDDYGFGSAFRFSLVVMAAMVVSVSVAVAAVVVAKGSHRAATRRWSWLLLVLDIAAVAVPTAWWVAGRELASAQGAVVLAGTATATVGAAVVSLDWVPLAHLWRRASALEDFRSPMLSFDFQQILVTMRRAGTASSRPVPRFNPARPWMPTQLWRQLSGMRATLASRLVLMGGAGSAAAALVGLADPSDGIVALGLAGVGFALGFELSAPLAATAGQVTMRVHYPKGSNSVLRRQLATAVVLALVLGLAGLGWYAATDQVTALAALALFVFGTLGASVQARLGSPDLADLVLRFGPSAIGPMLWIRALIGPILGLIMTIVVSHRWLRADHLGGAWEAYALAIVLTSLVLATYPMEKRFL